MTVTDWASNTRGNIHHFTGTVLTGNAIFTVDFGILPGCVVVLALAAIGTGVGTLSGQGVVLAQSTGRARSSGADFKTHRGRPTTNRAGFAGSDETLSGLVAVLAGDAIFTTVCRSGGARSCYR